MAWRCNIKWERVDEVRGSPMAWDGSSRSSGESAFRLVWGKNEKYRLYDKSTNSILEFDSSQKARAAACALDRARTSGRLARTTSRLNKKRGR